MKIAVLSESEAGERRVAASPETAKKYIGLGADVAVEAGAGAGASVADADFEAAGATIGTRAAVLKDADIILCVQGPDAATLKGAKQGALLVGGLNPFGQRARSAERIVSRMLSGVWFGTRRQVIFARALAGMTVFVPSPW